MDKRRVSAPDKTCRLEASRRNDSKVPKPVRTRDGRRQPFGPWPYHSHV